MNKEDSHYVRTSGIGLWRMWRRNFSSPKLAVLDLMDNSLDATLGGEGKIWFSPDVHQQTNQWTGVVLTNNCTRAPRPISDVLAVASSVKNAEEIGENGVGLKQSCACLSDLSFVLISSGGKFSIGILCGDIQKKDGIYMPHYEFENTSHQGLFYEQLSQRLQGSSEARWCVTKYGDGSFEAGVKRLFNHFLELTDEHGPWKPFHSTFRLIIHHPNTDLSTSHQNGVAVKSDTSADESSANTPTFLHNILGELPRHYLHISDDVEVRVHRQRVRFVYWQSRLVELTQCTLRIDPEILYTAISKNQLFHQSAGYKLRVFLGFDPRRVEDQGLTTASLHIYSRQSGRLIEEEKDARFPLGLASGSTQFCQGLTIIIDDYCSGLPLDPTKQNIAFGDEPCGQIHKCNLFGWAGAVAFAYWTHHFSKVRDLFAKPQDVLYKVIESHVDQMHRRSTNNFQPLGKADVNTIKIDSWSLRGWSGRTKRLRLHKPLFQRRPGTAWIIPSDLSGLPAEKKQAPVAKRKRSPPASSTPARSPSTAVTPEKVGSSARAKPAMYDLCDSSSDDNARRYKDGNGEVDESEYSKLKAENLELRGKLHAAEQKTKRETAKLLGKVEELRNSLELEKFEKQKCEAMIKVCRNQMGEKDKRIERLKARLYSDQMEL